MGAQDRADIIRKIRALFAKRIERGCKHGEEAAAREKAFELMKAYGISPAEIGPEAEPMSRFDYAVFSEELATELRAAAQQIRDRSRRSTIEIGRILLRVKSLLKHGQFLSHLRAFLAIECDMTLRTAENAMSAARLLGDPKNEIFSNLPIAGVYALARRKTPEVVREKVRIMLSEGHRPTVDVLKQMVSGGIGTATRSSKRPWEARARELIELLVFASQGHEDVPNEEKIRHLLLDCGLSELAEKMSKDSTKNFESVREAA